jgi:hypothetical protein
MSRDATLRRFQLRQPCYGIVYVGFKTQKRLSKMSAGLFRETARRMRSPEWERKSDSDPKQTFVFALHMSASGG